MLIDYNSKTVLVVDDHPGMRTSIRTTLSNFGIVKTDMASSALEATRRIRERKYDIIVCDYNLGEGRDGQQLLEELRLSKLIPQSTIYLMVTAEAGYEKVVAAAELAPDDYMVKPFTAETMRQRLDRIIEKKTSFSGIYQAIEGNRLDQAIELCGQLIESKPVYTIDGMRMQADLLVSAGRMDEAQQLYRQVIAMRPLPWARLGLARTVFLQGKLTEAEDLLQALTQDSPDFLAAYDLLAKVQEGVEKPDAAQATLAVAAARSPNTLSRQKVLGELALSNGDAATAEQAFHAVVVKGQHSILRSPDDHARLARAQVDQGKLDQAGKTLKELRSHYPQNPQAEFSASVIESLKAEKAGDSEGARSAMERALKLRSEHGIPTSEAMTLDLARAALASGAEEAGKQLVAELVNNDHENRSLLNRTQNMFSSLGRHEEGKALIEAGVKAAVNLNNAAVMKARQGDLDGAVDMLIEAATELPNNIQILLNAAHAILTQLKQKGWDDGRAQLAATYLVHARRRDPDHPKYIKVNALFRELTQNRKSAA